MQNPIATQSSSSSNTDIREQLVEALDDDELLFLDPPELDVAIVGVASRLGLPQVVVYDEEKLIDGFIALGMSDEEAIEWLGTNVEGAYVGERTPLVLRSVKALLG